MNPLTAPQPFYLATAAQSQKIDTDTINEYGIDGFTLMEIAGFTAASHLFDRRRTGDHGIFLCGKGNNAGDALVIARYLVRRGFPATIVFISGTDGLSEDTQHNLKLLNKLADNDEDAAPTHIVRSWQEFPPDMQADFIVDGMLGTGLSSELRADYAAAVEWANTSTLPVYSVDIPTGLHADTGRVLGNAVQAVETFTFGIRKQGLYLNEGFSHSGDVTFCDLPFPGYLKKDCSNYLLDESWVRPAPATPSRHKYDAGVLYLIAGSEGLTGAAILAAQSAWAEGLGAVILVCPHGILPVFENNLPQIIKRPVGSRKDYFLMQEHLGQVLDIIQEKRGKVLLGPGIGRNKTTVEFVEELTSRYKGDMLIDADGLWCLAQLHNWTKPAQTEWILTPHPGEFSTLTGEPASDSEQRLKQIKAFSHEKQVTVLSKGLPSIIGTQQGKSYLTGYDTRKFARAGFGDVLAGKVAAYWLLDNNAETSCALALLNGKQKIDSLTKKYPSRVAEPKDLI